MNTPRETQNKANRKKEAAMKKRRLCSVGLAILLAATAATGCGGSSAGESAAGASEGGTDDNTLVVAIQSVSTVTDYENNYLTKYLEDKLGINIEFYMLPTSADEVQTKISLMATSAKGLPYVLLVNGGLTPETILQYGNNGFFLPLNDYLSDQERMPNYNAIPAEDKAVMEEAQTQADGNTYSLSCYEPETWNLTPTRMFINKAWLDKLGLSVPTTTEELKNVLIAFRDQDPNGNGIQDEIGIYGETAGTYGQNVIAGLMNSFVFWNSTVNGGLSLSEDGSEVIAPFTTEGWKEGLKYLHDLYQEGLLAAATFTDDDTQYKATLNQDPQVVGLTSSGSLGSWPSAASNNNFLEMQLIAPLTGPEGIAYTPFSIYTPNQDAMILASSDKVDLALKFLDEFYDPYTSIVTRFGEEGVDWTRDEEKLAGMTNAYVEAGMYDHIELAYISNMWADNSAQTWKDVGPRYASLAQTNMVANGTVTYNADDPTQLNALCMELYYDKHPEHVLPTLHYTMDEATGIQDALLNIPDYVNQCLAEFVTGAKDIDGGWDSYLAELDSLGLQNWITTAQAAYDRTN